MGPPVAGADSHPERRPQAPEKRFGIEYLRTRTAEAAELTAAVDRRVRELEGVLDTALASPVEGIDLDTFKRARRQLPLRIDEEDLDPVPEPTWAQFAPRSPGLLDRVFGGSRRFGRRLSAAEERFADAVRSSRQAEDARRLRVQQAKRRQAEQQRQLDADVDAQHAKVERFANRIRRRDRDAVSEYFQRIVEAVGDPDGFPRQRRAAYVPESTLLAVEWELPSLDVVPPDQGYRYVQDRDAIEPTPRPDLERRRTYQRLVAQLALRALHVAFGADRYGVLDTVVFNGVVESVDPGSGRTVRPCLITLRATRTQFNGLVLDQLDPVACVRDHLAADVSAHPEELQAVEPVLSFEMADPRIVEAIDVLSGIDRRPNLLELTPLEFEHLVQNLFNRIGLDTKLFRGTADGGIDCVAYDPTPVTGGKVVIQAKLTTRTVSPSAIRDLYGTMQDAGAAKGILVTTSGFGPASYRFASGKPLQLIDGTGLLALCHEYDIPARILHPRAS
jgi:restriction system protein